MQHLFHFLKKPLSSITLIFLLFLTSCEKPNTIVSSVDEREANLIVVFLESKGIKAMKIKEAAGGGAGGEQTAAKFDISVDIRNIGIDECFFVIQQKSAKLVRLKKRLTKGEKNSLIA